MCPVGKAILGKYLALEIIDATFLQAFLSTFSACRQERKSDLFCRVHKIWPRK